VTTENTNSKHSDVEEAVAEQLPVSETILESAPPEVTGAQTVERQEQQEEGETSPVSGEFAEESAVHIPVADAEYETNDETRAFSFADVAPIVEESIARPFTDFIEEFRLAEEAHLSREEQQASSSVQAEVSASTDTPVDVPGEQTPSEAVAPVTPPVSPLLRPASRLRLPRHGGIRQREEQPDTETVQAVPSPASETASTQEHEREQPRPARRYRFDRPAASAAITPASTQARLEEGKEAAVRGSATTSTPTSGDDGNTVNEEMKGEIGQSRQSPRAVPSSEPNSSRQPATLETPTTNGNGTVTEPPSVTDHDRHHRQKQVRQREKEQAAPATPVAEAAAIVPEASTLQTTEIPPEDLPPLEYSELRRASSRRRRRRRSGEAATPAAPTANSGPTARSPMPEIPTTAPQLPMVAGPRAVVQTPGTPPATGQYNIVSGYTVSQMNQGNDGPGPFMSPEPSPARGSLPPRGSLRAVRPEVQRAPIYPVRTGDASMNQFANALVQAIQAQTDRMVNELRRTSQVPANVSVSFPSLPSTERVGVFVDVANLLYSARTLRITIDFGKLLDFLRGNRRLVRAQAYCPTSPQSSEDQMFLHAVKGLGYRITTKNYKTFSSGAKKADLDLDLCMDVVRLVDGRAVDSIVLVSGDSDFMPMLDYCSDHGVRVEVAAFDEAMSATLRQSCDLFINLAMLEDIRA
jgi:uncharacterized LabA/DUF88 family protein